MVGVLQAALAQQREEPAGLLAWAQAALTGAGGAAPGVMEEWSWAPLAQLAAVSLGSPQPAGAGSEEAAFHELDALCTARGLAQPFALADLPSALPGSPCMQLLLAVFLAQLRRAAEPPPPPAAADMALLPPPLDVSCDVMQQESADNISPTGRRKEILHAMLAIITQ